MGRLSNPPEATETLAGQGSQASRRSRKTTGDTPNRASDRSTEASAEEKGRLSNPVQRRLSGHDLDDLTRAYVKGSSIDALARRFSIHRTTVIGHLDRLGVPRRRAVRRMTDRTVQQGASRYRRGESLKVVAARFGVDARTLAREFRRAGVQIRPRRGWPTPA